MRAGLNISQLVTKEQSLREIPGNKSGFHAGAVVNIPIAQFGTIGQLDFQPGLLLTTRGFRSYEKTDFHEYEYKTSIYYLEVPVMLSYKIPVTQNYGWRLNLGLPVGFGLGSMTSEKEDGETQDDFESENVFEAEEAGDPYMKRFDLSLGMGLGVDIKHFYLGVGYNLGLLNVMNFGADKENFEDVSVKHRAFTISVGYNF